MESAEGAIAQGFVANISETGACVRTEVGFAPGSELLLRLDFSRHPQPFSATGRVVWQGGSSSVGAGAIGHGVQWTYDGPHRVRLRLAIRALVGQA
jgi:Tfp pilus assembly protein PilZ